MKIIAAVFSFALGVGLIMTFRTDRTAGPAPGGVEAGTAREEECGCEGAFSDEQFRYANHMDPGAYMETYEAIQGMPSEADRRDSRPKGARSPSAGESEWESFGPTAVPELAAPNGNKLFGRIRRMKWYYNTGAAMWEIYLGAGSGGLWYGTGNGGWVSVGDMLPNPSVGAIAVDPVNPAVLFVGTGDWGRDNGAGLFKTTDQGLSWSSVILPKKPEYVTEILYLVGSTVMIMSTNKGVFKSTDGGAAWTVRAVDTSNQYAACYNLVAATASTLYATLPGFGSAAGGVFKSSDGGETWSKLAGGLPATSGNSIALDVGKSNTEVLYASYTDAQSNFGGVYRSINGGSDWLRMPDPASYITAGQGNHVNVIRVHPDSASVVYAAGVGMVKSTTMGNSWTVYGRETRGHDDITSIEFDPSNPDLVYFCSDGGILPRNESNGVLDNANYTFTPGAPLQVYEADYAWSESSVMAAGTQDNGSMVTVGASQPGSVWSAFSGCDGAKHLTIDPGISSLFYFNQWCNPAGLDPRLRSDSQGTGNTTIDGSLPLKSFVPIRLARGGTTPLFTVTSSTLYYSYTRGNIWSPAVFFGANFSDWPVTLSVNNYAPSSGKACYITGPPGKLYVATGGTPGSMIMGDMTSHLPVAVKNCVADRWRPNVAYAFTTGRIFRTSDRGSNWTEITGNLKNLTALEYYDITSAQHNANALYLASGLGMWKTVDGGLHWIRFQTGLPIVGVTKILVVPGVYEDTLRIATYGRGFWQRLVNDVDPNYLVQPVSGTTFTIQGKLNRLYAAGSEGGALVSTDNGNSWGVLETGTPAGLRAAGIPGDLEVILAGDSGTVLRSTDGGAAWNHAVVPAGNITGMSITAGGIAWMCADDGSLLKSIDGGIDWMPQAGFAGIPLASCRFTDDLHGWLLGGAAGGGTDAVVYRTTDGGDTWTPSVLPTAHPMARLFVTSDTGGYAVGDSGTIVRTTDGGVSWSILETGTGASLRDCFFSDDLTGWVVGDSGVLLMTGDGGETWAQSRDSSTGDLRAVALSGPNLIVGGDGAIYRSSQVHRSTTFYSLNDRWNLVSLPVDVSDSSVAALFPTAQSAAYSYDGGYSEESVLGRGRGYWLKFAGDQVVQVTGTPSGSVSIPVGEGWNLIGSASIYTRTEDIASSPPGIVTSEFYSYGASYAVAGTIEPGKGYWVKAGQPGMLILSSSPVVPPGAGRIRIVAGGEPPPPPPSGDTAGGAPLPIAYAVHQNYPNPFNPSTVISYSLPVRSLVSLKIYDMLGREVETLVDATQDAGAKSITWDGAGRPSGVYFCRIEAGAFTSVIKMALVK